MPSGEQFVGDFRYRIPYNGIMCTVFDFSPQKFKCFLKEVVREELWKN